MPGSIVEALKKAVQSKLLPDVPKKILNSPKYTQEVIAVKRKVGGGIYRNLFNASMQPDATHDTESKQTLDLGNVLRGLDVTEDNSMIVIDSAIILHQCNSASPFVLQPFAVLMENGETFTRQTGTETDPLTQIESAITGAFGVKLGTMSVSTRIFSNGTAYFISEFSHDVTESCRKYMKSVQRDILQQTNKEEFVIGNCVVMRDTNTSLTDICYILINYHEVETPLNANF